MFVGEGHQDDITTPRMTDGVFESKYEIDSLCAFLKLSYWYYKSRYPSGDEEMLKSSVFLAHPEWVDAVALALTTIQTMIDNNGQGAYCGWLI